MPNNDEMRPVIRCSFCGKTQDAVDRMVLGPGVSICNECIELCHSILHEDEPLPKAGGRKGCRGSSAAPSVNIMNPRYCRR